MTAPLALSLLLAASSVTFNRDVRPILSDKCFACHGPDAKTKNIPLRLDVETEARRVIAPGQPDASELMRRVTAAQPARRMPPAFTGHQLTEKEVATLRQWIAEGAAWQKHWAFLPPERAPIPAVKNPAWPRQDLDRFILARLEAEGLAPTPEAAPETLLRRAAIDLTGLPPTPAELAAFRADRSPRAYENAVDRLLASPRYGERMAVRWLDAARYADSNGYQFDGERVMWRWRDWVIEAFNRNLPHNQFALEQLAGDLLPNPTFDQRLATGFNRNHRGNTEDGIIPEEYAVEYVVDRVETTSTVFLGLTLGCARCHNHKYDPFTQQEFYRMFAYFNNIPENGRAMKYGNSPPLMRAPTRSQQQSLAKLDAQIAVQRTAAAHAPAATEEHWWPQAGLQAWFPFDFAERAEPAGRWGKAARLDGTASVDFAGVAQHDITEHFSWAAWVKLDATTGALLSHMSDSPRGRGIGLYAEDGRLHFHLTSNYDSDALRVDSREAALTPGRWQHVAVTYDGTVSAAGIHLYVDGRELPFKVDQETLYRPLRNAGGKFNEPLRIGGGGGKDNRLRGLVDDVLIYGRVLSGAEVAAIAGHAPASVPRRIDAAWRSLEALEYERDLLVRTFPTSMVMAENAERRPTHLLLRGAYDKPGEKVEPGVPAVLPPLRAGALNNRLGLAQWLIDPKHPLTARVAVNRIWQLHFGTGLVKTVEDFGQQGEWPSHPELLDWLATEFVRTGWDMKAMHRLIVTSAAYRQSSRATPELLQRDPENRLLARGPRYRLAAEMIRDASLQAAGLLHEKLGGPSVKPYQPDGLWNELAMQDMHYSRSQGADLYRRGLYTFWKRTIAPPMMVNFDAANREACVVKENRTNTPLQALNLMNDVTFLEAAKFIAQRMIREGGPDSAARLRHGFELVLSRTPRAAEMGVLRDNLAYHLDYFASPEKAQEFLAQGESKTDTSLAPRELAAYSAVASLLLNLDEAVTKE
ncbi:MAG: DUF1553 domain-containing protein [Acidobacteria bacterium]|nr:DUF1553 domain-containing protein [Acidobacteriota bacterium]